MGDREAFSRLYDATSGKLFSVCLRVLKQRDVAEDAMQDAYVKIWKNAGRYNVTSYSPMSWLIAIARNSAIDRLRKQKPTQDIDDYIHHFAATGPTPEQSAVASSEVKRIMGCLDELETDRRDAIKGAYLDGETYKDLSARFNIPLNTMRTWLRRGLANLRECMSR
ncbi:sigma-70 family RNA polymerase sigma factor [Cognatiyoonia koreensis]